MPEQVSEQVPDEQAQAASPAADRIEGGVHQSQQHDSAVRHVTGEAAYIDDLAEPVGLLHVYLGLSDHAHARVRGLDLSAVQAAPGVALVLTAADIPGSNDVSPTHRHDEPN
jgi:xanthine dehydrogenase large subunit